MARGMVLTLSLWDDHDVGMIWLDATDPYPIPPGKFGAPRGTCNQTSGNSSIVEKRHPGAHVLFSDVRYGEIGSTSGPGAPPPPPACPGGSKAECIKTCVDPAQFQLGPQPSEPPRCLCLGRTPPPPPSGATRRTPPSTWRASRRLRTRRKCCWRPRPRPTPRRAPGTTSQAAAGRTAARSTPGPRAPSLAATATTTRAAAGSA